MSQLNWPPDPATATAAGRVPLPIRATAPAFQFGGFNFDPRTWARRVLSPARWPQGRLVSTPRQITDLFAAGADLEALAMVVSWGGMGRTSSKYIYADRPLRAIQATLDKAASSIRRVGSIANAWVMLTGRADGQLGWSPVFASKTLHFLCRSLGFEKNPPVAVDGAVIRQAVWPAWRRVVPPELMPRPWPAPGRADFDAYLRYMTAIVVWAQERHWTTTEMEATIFAEYRTNR